MNSVQSTELKISFFISIHLFKTVDVVRLGYAGLDLVILDYVRYG